MGVELSTLTPEVTRGKKWEHEIERLKTQVAQSASRYPPMQSHAAYGSRPNILNVNLASTKGEQSRVTAKSEVGESHHNLRTCAHRSLGRCSPDQVPRQHNINIPTQIPSLSVECYNQAQMRYSPVPGAHDTKISPEHYQMHGSRAIRRAFQIGPFVKWIRDVLPDSNLKLP